MEALKSTRRTSDRGSRIGTLERGNRGWTWSKHKEGIDDGLRGAERGRARDVDFQAAYK